MTEVNDGMRARGRLRAVPTVDAAVPADPVALSRVAEAVTELPPGVAPWFTVIIPTRNEAGNIGLLLEKLGNSLTGVTAEVLFVDDSSDGTDDVVRLVGRTSGLAVRLLHRRPGDRVGGLSGAVVAGLRMARGSWAVIMDGDLQHPPELVPQLVAVGLSRGLDLVAATRKTDDGSTDGLSRGYRRATSGIATTVSKVLFRGRLSRLSDPMSGFFAVRLAALRLESLNPVGFKILLEIAVRQPRLLVAEVPFAFGVRFEGESKASAAERIRFVRHLARLRLNSGRPPRVEERSVIQRGRPARYDMGSTHAP